MTTLSEVGYEVVHNDRAETIEVWWQFPDDYDGTEAIPYGEIYTILRQDSTPRRAMPLTWEHDVCIRFEGTNGRLCARQIAPSESQQVVQYSVTELMQQGAEELLQREPDYLERLEEEERQREEFVPGEEPKHPVPLEPPHYGSMAARSRGTSTQDVAAGLLSCATLMIVWIVAHRVSRPAQEWRKPLMRT
eukprot:gnl/TRDRNA2_/TRDRNA2_39648_c0_seq1.p1 gnl/TRDRNA2_/TRDRNA2_39648_c0~~gnl/TRDRNA2_/TRDRNA2_39648_c0_seq1.p1  ORF type:complete len:191 (-),score=16.26 gnl/TRDRNA2_/TRDRNA2_39648_c0_seq1:203-775(-)